MQTFSNMQRSITYQNALVTLLWVGVFTIYSALGSIYLYLPPMLAVAGFLFYRSLIRNDLFSLIVYTIILLMIETEKGYWFGSTIVFFAFLSYYLLPHLKQNIQCENCIKGLFVVFSYLLFWMLMTIANKMLLLESPLLDWHVVFYMLIEFSIIVVLG
jgi:hypothetical protein